MKVEREKVFTFFVIVNENNMHSVEHQTERRTFDSLPRKANSYLEYFHSQITQTVLTKGAAPIKIKVLLFKNFSSSGYQSR